MASVLAFDIETIPDVAGLRLLRGADPTLSDGDVYAAEIADRAARNKSDFMPLHLQRVLVISCVFRAGKGLQVRSFVDLERDGRSEGCATASSPVATGTWATTIASTATTTTSAAITCVTSI
jgi:hypothetical protein